jgi:hypothetical protein
VKEVGTIFLTNGTDLRKKVSRSVDDDTPPNQVDHISKKFHIFREDPYLVLFIVIPGFLQFIIEKM